ncbi:MAG: hypothetical protein LC778_09760, partial [Acidobacteria bacterium]|nr:hypothetical protein [Acidobacteriota bacterium]
IMDDVNDKLDWATKRLNEEIGEQNPISQHLIAARYRPLATSCKVIEPTLDSSMKVRVFKEEPDTFVDNLSAMLIEQAGATANTMGHIWYEDVVNTYTEAAVEAGEGNKAQQAQEQMVGLFKERKVTPSVVETAENRLKALKGSESRGNSRAATKAKEEGRATSFKDSDESSRRKAGRKAK